MYEVEPGADSKYAKGQIKYMEQENYVGDRLINKTFYNEDQTLRGKEVYDYSETSEHPTGSKFYGPESNILSNYTYKYQDSLKIESRGFEGDGNELLRIEGFKYDIKGNLVSKTIYNSFNQKQKTFLFGHDSFGNEVTMVLLNENDDQILSEKYEIVTRTKDGEWLEKWGYLDNNKTPVTFYHKRKSE